MSTPEKTSFRKMAKRPNRALLARLVVFGAAVQSCAAAAPNLFLVSRSPDNDVVRLLLGVKAGVRIARVATANAALTAAGPGDAVLLLADGYPAVRTAVPTNLSLVARARGIRAYVEFPDTADPAAALSWKQRAVVTTPELEPHGLRRLRILQLQEPVAVDVCGSAGRAAPATTRDGRSNGTSAACAAACNSSLVSFAQVAGVDSATFGVTDAERTPLLYFNDSSSRVLLAASKLSNMASGRYAPHDAWRQLWGFILVSLLQEHACHRKSAFLPCSLRLFVQFVPVTELKWLHSKMCLSGHL